MDDCGVGFETVGEERAAESEIEEAEGEMGVRFQLESDLGEIGGG